MNGQNKLVPSSPSAEERVRQNPIGSQVTPPFIEGQQGRMGQCYVYRAVEGLDQGRRRAFTIQSTSATGLEPRADMLRTRISWTRGRPLRQIRIGVSGLPATPWRWRRGRRDPARERPSSVGLAPRRRRGRRSAHSVQCAVAAAVPSVVFPFDMAGGWLSHLPTPWPRRAVALRPRAGGSIY